MRNSAAGGIPWRSWRTVSMSTEALVVIILLTWVKLSVCLPFVGITDPTDPNAFPVNNPAFVDYITGVINGRMTNLTQLFVQTNLAKHSGYCIDNPQMEWDRAFNFSKDLTFVSNCIRTQGDITQRVCTAKEINLYFNSFSQSGTVGPIESNNNCNRTSWVNGCEPGWGCRANSNVQANLTNSLEVPERTQDCQSCCEGFFCPRGITCMIPCPLGSHCPLAKLNEASGVCEPYNYQLLPGQPNHTCGGANIWADVGSSGTLFCSAGSYCPTSIQQSNCSKGNYCPRGSTAEKRCFKLTSCDPSTANQNIHAYGAMLIAVLATVLLIIYNCSDQVITTRERRRAKTREAAVRSVKEKMQARARWKSAKIAAKKQATELQSQVSQKFTRKKIAIENEDIDVLSAREPGPKDSSHSSTDPGHSNALPKSPFSSNHPLMRMMQETGDQSDSFTTEIVNNGAKTKAEMEKQINTESQIFRYAYAELEKEKAQQQQNKNLTFSGVVAMATNTKTRKRPLIEIAFRDLTVTLKGKNRHLLRSVTGKTRPGRITAIMGPSGAGKTTFLSALAGKAVGCTMSGLILINGTIESIHSYRKIVGFVPQDDIVHGNLTVEENLWFSARCRLSSDLPKPDKVLIVERVIESLGLLTVRNSLVGTVEKRGISGGQRKRVNVGLEMVMEPSVLFLDEPTSGLDSSSSQLLLRALRREALEGVNICMVVHQPSFTLFTMFDELILLAKGGLTVYHGPVSNVEAYFSGLGIDVPDRVNPPDYYIDVLEELIKPRSGSNFHYAELPVRWMLHNGYPVPPDMQQYAASLNPLPTDLHGDDSYIHDEVYEEQSFAGEMWQDVKCDIQRRRDILQNNFFSLKDLSGRRTPSALMQYKLFLGRLGKQRLREARMQAFDLLTLLVAGACLGSLSMSRDEQFGAPGYIHTIIAVSLLCKIAALRSFSMDKLQYWRESASGISSLAHFVAKDTIDLFNTIIKPVVYLSMYYFFNNPRSSFADNYVVLLSLVYCVTGIAYALAIFLDHGPSQLLSVLLPVVFTLVATQTGNSKLLKIIAEFCYPKWALEAFVIANARRYYGVWIITRCAVLRKSGYVVQDWYLGICILILAGIAFRVLAFLGMLTNRKR